jgi:hypothetical protein
MKKLIPAVLLMIVVLLTGCEKEMSNSNFPTFYVIREKSQDEYQKGRKTAQYYISAYTTDGQHQPSKLQSYWFTLEETFEAGDTLRFTKTLELR